MLSLLLARSARETKMGRFGKFVVMCLLAVCGAILPAHADAIYVFNGTIPLTLTLTDSAVTAGGVDFSVFAYSAPCGPSEPYTCSFSGDPSGFVSFTVPFSGVSAPNYVGDYLFDIGIDPAGTLFGSIVFSSYESTLHLSGGGLNWTGTFSSDGPLCFSAPCAVTGYFQGPAVPEPFTLSLFGAGLGLVAMMRLKNKAAS